MVNPRPLILFILILSILIAPALGQSTSNFINPGFENGVISPWTSSGATLSQTNSHSGIYCVFITPGGNVQQTGVPCQNNVSFWMSSSNGLTVVAHVMVDGLQVLQPSTTSQIPVYINVNLSITTGTHTIQVRSDGVLSLGNMYLDDFNTGNPVFPAPITQPPAGFPGRLITINDPNATITPFTNTYMTDMMNVTIQNNTSNINPATDIFIMLKEYRDQLGIYTYVFIMGTIAAMYILTSNRPYQPVVILLLGNGLFLFLLPLDWISVILTMALFTLAFLFFITLKGRIRA